MTDSFSFEGTTVLPDWGVILASGPDAATFLHSQFSNDIKNVSTHQGRLSAYCTPKGRVLANFIVGQSAATSPSQEAQLLLSCHASVLEAMLKRLKMFVLRAKVTLSTTPQHVVLGIVGTATAQNFDPHATQLTPWQALPCHEGTLIKLGDGETHPRWLWIGPESTCPHSASSPSLPLPIWRWLEVRSTLVPISAAMSEKFIPQTLNYDLIGGVDFKKGCYPGQEIVARTHYLGKISRRSILVHSPTELIPGTEAPCGLVIDAAPHPTSGWDALIEVKTQLLAENLQGFEGVERIPMLYEV
jgi:folate-binding protein YgfZ